MMGAAQGFQALRQSDEADGQGAVLEYLAHAVVPVQLFGIQPHALAHEEGEVVDLFVGDDFKALQKLLMHQVQHALQLLKEPLHVALCLDGDAGKVDGGEGEVAAAGADLPGGIVDVADHAGAAAHVGDFGFGVALLIILLVEGRVHEAEIGEEALGAGADGQTIQVVVGIAGIEADALLDAEDLDGEDGRFAVAKARLGGQKNVAHYHAAFWRGIHAIVDGGERHLRARAAVHGVEVVDKRLHGLIGRLVGFLFGMLAHEVQNAGINLPAGGGHGLRNLLNQRPIIAGIGGQAGLFAGFLLQLVQDARSYISRVLHIAQQLQRTGQVVAEPLEIGLFDTRRHAVVKVDHALAAMLVVLVGLDGNARQGGIAVDIVGLTQHAVTRGESAVEQFQQVDLAAGGGQGVKVQVMNMDIAIAVRLCMPGIEHIHLIELLGTLRAELEHAAHGGIAVDVGVFALDVGVDGILVGDVLEDLHQAGIHLTHPTSFRAVEDIALGRTHEAAFNQHALHHILHLLHGGHSGKVFIPLDFLNDDAGQLLGRFLRLLAAAGHEALFDRLLDLLLIEGDNAPVALFNGCNHVPDASINCYITCRPPPPKQGDFLSEHHHYIVLIG